MEVLKSCTHVAQFRGRLKNRYYLKEMELPLLWQTKSLLGERLLRDEIICIVCVQHADSMPYSLSSCQGQSEDTIRLIIKQVLIKLLLPRWLMTLQSLEPPPGARNAHLLDVCSTADVKLALKLRSTNAY